MPDVVLDTNVLADFLDQYFNSAQSGRRNFTQTKTIRRKTVLEINRIVRWHQDSIFAELPDSDYPGLIVASTLAFVEIARKWRSVVSSRFSLDQFLAFIEQPPDWFVIEPVDENLVMVLTYVPTHIGIPRRRIGQETRAIEWTDAIHIATAKARGKHTLLAATDREIEPVTI